MIKLLFRDHHAVRIALGALGLALSAPVLASDELTSETLVNKWSNPSVIGARRYEKSVVGAGTFLYSKFKGKTLEGKGWLIGGSPTDTLYLWYSRQNFLAKGASATSRLRASADSYGLKWVFKKARNVDEPSWALQYEAVKTFNATAVVAGAGATYFPTKNQALSVHYETPGGSAYSLGFTTVKAAGQGNSDVLSFGYGKDIFSNDRSTLRFQAFLIGQKTNLIANSRTDFRAVAQLMYQNQLTKWLFFEAEGAILPAGMPYAGGRTTGLSSFLIYDPGGAAEGLRKGLVGYGVIRLVARWTF